MSIPADHPVGRSDGAIYTLWSIKPTFSQNCVTNSLVIGDNIFVLLGGMQGIFHVKPNFINVRFCFGWDTTRTDTTRTDTTQTDITRADTTWTDTI